MKVLVTGASGFVGRELVPQLLGAGHHIRALVHSRDVAGGCEKITGALPEAALAKRLCAGMDAVVHAAGIAHVNAGIPALRAQNLDATLELAAAAKAQGVRKFIFLSSCKARYPEHSAYARFKAEAENALQKLHVPGTFEVICLRPALVYGKGMRGNLRSLLRLLRQPRLPIFLASANPFALISVQDLCRAIICVLASQSLPSQVWELSDGTEHTLDNLIREVRGSLKLDLPVLMLPRPLFRGAAFMAELMSPIVRTGFSMSTYRTLFEEVYRPDAEFSRHTGFAVQDAFPTRLPELLEDVAA
jgi:UDP-glucose 4-epimerase